jgi:hypothetical protein
MRKVAGYLFISWAPTRGLRPKSARASARVDPEKSSEEIMPTHAADDRPRLACHTRHGSGSQLCALAQNRRPGVSDTEIKVGQTIAHSGPVSAYGQIGLPKPFFKMINDRGGINGRKITSFRSTTAIARRRRSSNRRLVEQDGRRCSACSAPSTSPPALT